MEQNASGLAKKIWQIVKVAIFMLRRGICKKKILLDLNLTMKCGNLAGKSLRNLMFHHHHYFSHSSSKRKGHQFDDAEAVNRVLEFMKMSSDSEVAASPAIRQIRVTDSPFPLQNNPDENSRVVDQAAEDFINKFYSKLKQQQ